MKLSTKSKNRLLKTFHDFEIHQEYVSVLYNYLVNGFSPGSFFIAFLANDGVGAFSRSHPNNSVAQLSNIAKWVTYYLTRDVVWGSYDAVEKWLNMSSESRRYVLECCTLIYTEEQEVIMILKDDTSESPRYLLYDI